MAPSTVQLQDDQKFALMKFRRSVSDVLQPFHDDNFLLRWLRARNWNSEAAEKMLRNSMEWRKKWEVDTTLKTWEAPEALLKHYPSGQAGYDKEGSAVILFPFLDLDIWGLLHSVTKQDIIKLTIQILEHYLGIAKNSGSPKVTVVFDMEGFVLRHYAWRPAAELVISLIQLYEGNYPEILNICYIINAPSVFSLAFNIVKKFMGEYTINKIHIYKADPKKWKPILQERLTLKDFPKHYGGEMVDPDGNPRCPSKIRIGGKVPKSYYLKNQSNLEEEFISDTVKKGKQLVLDFLAVEEGSYLKWHFYTEEHDIKFGITSRSSEGAESVVVPLQRVESHTTSEVGFVPCDYPATYTVLFDNSYSMMRNKKIFYKIIITQSIEKLKISTLPDNDLNAESEDTSL